MVQGTFVLSAYRQKNPQEQRKVDYRQSYMRYVVVVIAIFVVFGCEYCFDNASVILPTSRLCRPTSQAI